MCIVGVLSWSLQSQGTREMMEILSEPIRHFLSLASRFYSYDQWAHPISILESLRSLSTRLAFPRTFPFPASVTVVLGLYSLCAIRNCVQPASSFKDNVSVSEDSVYPGNKTNRIQIEEMCLWWDRPTDVKATALLCVLLSIFDQQLQQFINMCLFVYTCMPSYHVDLIENFGNKLCLPFWGEYLPGPNCIS